MRQLVRRRPLTAVLLCGLFLAATAAPLHAADTGTQFTLTAGSLGISVPTSSDLGTAPVDSATIIGNLGAVTVTDTRGALTATWTASVSSSNFTTGSATTSETISKGAIVYTTGTPTATSGTGAFTPTGGSLATTAVAGAWLGTGSNSATWNPTITVTIAPGKVAGTYTGIITHSVA